MSDKELIYATREQLKERLTQCEEEIAYNKKMASRFGGSFIGTIYYTSKNTALQKEINKIKALLKK